MEKRDVVLKLLGFFILAFGIFAMAYGVYRDKPDWIFWFCYIGMVLIGIGILKKDGILIASQLNIITVYLVFWDVDFLYRLFTKESLWGITDYFFNNLIIQSRIISLEHFFLLPLAFYALYRIKLTPEEKKVHWKLSLIQLILIYFIVKFLASETYNVNCVFNSCVSFIPTNEFHILTWFAINLGSVLITAFVINKVKWFDA